MVINSLQNPKVKHAVKLRNRRYRDDNQQLLIEGLKPVRAAISSGWPIQELYICKELLDNSTLELIERVSDNVSTVLETSKEVMAKMAYRDRPEGALALAPYRPNKLASIKIHPNGLYLIATAIEKPGNLGTMLRTADACGADGVIVCDPITDVYNPNVIRASLGALFTVPLAVCSSEELFVWCSVNSVQLVVTTPTAKQAYSDFDLTESTAIVIGTEQTGLSDEWLNDQKNQALIPMYGEADSLNAATSAAIMLYEAVRQRRNAHMIA